MLPVGPFLTDTLKQVPMNNISTITRLWAPLIGVFFLVQDALGQAPLPAGMQFQMVAKRHTGEYLANEDLFARVSLLSETAGKTTVHYSEVHSFQTNTVGQGQFVIGQGMAGPATFNDIPWEQGDIELEIQITSDRLPDFQMFQRTPLRTVPYAFYAERAGQLAGDQTGTLRSTGRHNTRWLTSGNSETRPPIHFLGNEDDKDLVFVTNGKERFRVGRTGQLIVEPDVSVAGSQSNPDNYPMVITGGGQGIWIDIDENRSNNTNFLTFRDSEKIQGAVEGQTDSEWRQEAEYIWQAAIYVSEGVSLGVQIGLLIADAAAAFGAAGCSAVFGFPFVIFIWAVPGFVLQGSGLIAESVAKGVEVAALLDASISWETNTTDDLGVRFTSGGADYAEWLPQSDPEEKMEYGEIVGVHGGTISKDLEGAEHILVVSESPIILGNHPLDDHKQKAGHPVAFMGQVRVRVAGAVDRGDFVLPSGNNDGVGIAVSPDSLQPADYPNIVGRAWESAPDLAYNLVNVAIGLDHNQTAQRLQQIDSQLDQVIAYLSDETGEASLDLSLVEGRPCTDCPAPANLPVVRPQDFWNTDQTINFSGGLGTSDEVLAHNRVLIEEAYAKGRTILERQGVDLSKYPFFNQLFSDPVPILQRAARDPNYIDQAIRQTYSQALEIALAEKQSTSSTSGGR